jgi:hypothetical protein
VEAIHEGSEKKRFMSDKNVKPLMARGAGRQAAHKGTKTAVKGSTKTPAKKAAKKATRRGK